jgi:hypothetical protein
LDKQPIGNVVAGARLTARDATANIRRRVGLNPAVDGGQRATLPTEVVLLISRPRAQELTHDLIRRRPKLACDHLSQTVAQSSCAARWWPFQDRRPFPLRPGRSTVEFDSHFWSRTAAFSSAHENPDFKRVSAVQFFPVARPNPWKSCIFSSTHPFRHFIPELGARARPLNAAPFERAKSYIADETRNERFLTSGSLGAPWCCQKNYSSHESQYPPIQ